jgi:hypothetical protein
VITPDDLALGFVIAARDIAPAMHRMELATPLVSGPGLPTGSNGPRPFFPDGAFWVVLAGEPHAPAHQASDVGVAPRLEAGDLR